MHLYLEHIRNGCKLTKRKRAEDTRKTFQRRQMASKPMERFSSSSHIGEMDVRASMERSLAVSMCRRGWEAPGTHRHWEHKYNYLGKRIWRYPIKGEVFGSMTHVFYSLVFILEKIYACALGNMYSTIHITVGIINSCEKPKSPPIEGRVQAVWACSGRPHSNHRGSCSYTHGR